MADRDGYNKGRRNAQPGYSRRDSNRASSDVSMSSDTKPDPYPAQALPARPKVTTSQSRNDYVERARALLIDEEPISSGRASNLESHQRTSYTDQREPSENFRNNSIRQNSYSRPDPVYQQSSYGSTRPSNAGVGQAGYQRPEPASQQSSYSNTPPSNAGVGQSGYPRVVQVGYSSDQQSSGPIIGPSSYSRPEPAYQQSSRGNARPSNPGILDDGSSRPPQVRNSAAYAQEPTYQQSSRGNARPGNPSILDDRSSRPPQARSSATYAPVPSVASGKPRHDAGVQPRSQVKKLVHDFLKEVPFRDYHLCVEFINDNPAILREPGVRGELLSRAQQSLRENDLRRAKSCIEKALIVKDCRSMSRSDMADFFRSLCSQDRQAERAFGHTVNGVVEELRQANARDNFPDHPSYMPNRQDSTSITGAGSSSASLSSPQPVNVYTGMNPTSPGAPPRPPTIPQEYPSNTTQRMPESVSFQIRNQPQGQDPIARSTQGGFNSTNPAHTITQTDALDDSWQVRPAHFFKLGRVFAIVWPESMGNVAGPVASRSRGIVAGRYGEQIYSHIRRFVVVRERNNYSLAVGITTYGGLGLTAKNMSPEDIAAHAVICNEGSDPPPLLPGKRPSGHPIRMLPSGGMRLEPSSVINFAKIHTIEHNVVVKDIGTISQNSIPLLTKYWLEQMSQ